MSTAEKLRDVLNKISQSKNSKYKTNTDLENDFTRLSQEF